MSELHQFRQQHDKLLSQLAPLWPKVDGLRILPPCFVEMDGMFVAFSPDPGMLTAVFPIHERYLNPFSVVQGGFLTAMIDNTVGPLSMLIGPPSMTTHLSSTFMRPVTDRLPWVRVVAEVVRNGRQQVHFEVRLFDPKDKLCVAATASFLRPN